MKRIGTLKTSLRREALELYALKGGEKKHKRKSKSQRRVVEWD